MASFALVCSFIMNSREMVNNHFYTIAVLAALVNYIGEKAYGTPGSSDHYEELEWSVYRQFIPLLVGLLVQRCFPRAKTLSSITLKWFLTPFSIARFTLRLLATDWDLFAYKLVTFNVSDNHYYAMRFCKMFKLIYSFHSFIQSVLAGFGLTFGVNILALASAFVCRLKFEDCSTIAVEVVTKVLPLVEFFKNEYTRKEGDLFDLLYVITVLSIPVVLLTHLGFKIIR